ncbi:MAG TPA: helix-turn-helix transcriptional regulator [Conexibacter sp.]|nr:helix-turn-helix transcriptional regulator [Conexibacter sp.]
MSDFGRRIRAARGYAGLSQAELAEAIKARHPTWEVSLPTVKRLEKRGADGVKGSQSQWSERIAAACGVPRWFLERGFEGIAVGDDDLEERVAVLERVFNGLLLASAGAPAPPGELARRLEALLTSAQGRSRPDSSPGMDARRGTEPS